ncbi:MauE/DoxX family redox-associated membrane protein [Nonomuraea pusilla]|uniref:Methylamine utilisation protein MauE n=1 Tax=Nonomuraea pusilla TaxID=46177 RepID=A0A1H7QBD2_9ACTN|nr:MauE/DoxX family redox-associated membrane protein [Nonomuraea pusilla]SEL45058.1 Methylamine utilisation protein MauE [Nonomuraea pusilla]
MLESQLPAVIVLLLLGTAAKLVTVRTGGEPGALSRLGPAVLVPGRMQAPALLFCAAVEAVLAAGLLLTTHPAFRWGTAAFFAMSTYVLLELRRRRPDAGCGCFGEVSSAPVGLRSVGRTVALTGMALLSVWAPVPGWAAFTHPTWYAAAGVALLAALSPEVEELINRVRYRAPCEQRPAPAESVTLGRLRASGTWRAHRDELTSADPYDSWRELCWRFFAFRNRSGEDVVFAVYLSGRRPAVRVAVVTPEDSDSLPTYTQVSA